MFSSPFIRMSASPWRTKRTAAAAALEASVVETRQVEAVVTYNFPYVMMNSVMRVVKELKPRIISQTYDSTCEIKLGIRKSEEDLLKSRLEKLSFE